MFKERRKKNCLKAANSSSDSLFDSMAFAAHTLSFSSFHFFFFFGSRLLLDCRIKGYAKMYDILSSFNFRFIVYNNNRKRPSLDGLFQLAAAADVDVDVIVVAFIRF